MQMTLSLGIFVSLVGAFLAGILVGYDLRKSREHVEKLTPVRVRENKVTILPPQNEYFH
jgi:hypothetical protein